MNPALAYGRQDGQFWPPLSANPNQPVFQMPMPHQNLPLSAPGSALLQYPYASIQYQRYNQPSAPYPEPLIVAPFANRSNNEFLNSQWMQSQLGPSSLTARPRKDPPAKLSVGTMTDPELFAARVSHFGSNQRKEKKCVDSQEKGVQSGDAEQRRLVISGAHLPRHRFTADENPWIRLQGLDEGPEGASFKENFPSVSIEDATEKNGSLHNPNDEDEDERFFFSEDEDDPTIVNGGDNSQSVDRVGMGFEGPASEIRLTHFQNLNKILILIFSGKEIGEPDWCLTPLEAKILNSILHRKFYSKVQADGIRLDESDRYAFINQLARINTLKRPKDCYKMLLGRLFRILKRNFFEKNASSNQNVYLFYQYYFGDLASAEGQQIQAYFYPFERNNKFTSLFPKISHHLNFRYYERIFRSDRFATDIRAVLERVYADHFSELKFKFSTLLKKWERLFFNFDGDSEIVEKSILKYLQHNNRCKIPFTAVEIHNSITLFERMISKFGRAREGIKGHSFERF